MKRRSVGLAVGLALLLGLGAVGAVLPGVAEDQLNRLITPPPYDASAQARAVHKDLFIADLHDDLLMWGRDPLQRHTRGHSDLPRLLQGQVALQVFATVTKSPKGLNYERNPSDSDTITALVMAQRWPVRTWNSLLERALYQSEKLHRAAAQSQGRLVVLRTRADLDAFEQAWKTDPQRLAAVLATEGLQPLEGRLENVDRLYDAGFRMAGLTHFFDNEVGGSAHGMEKKGLTPLGREVVRRLEDKRMLIDLAHASKPLIDDVLAMARRPVLVSHTGVAGTCPGPRNLSDAHLKRIAATGGVVGIGYWNGAVCQPTIPNIVKAMRYAVDQVGIAHVALGSDFNGATRMPFDVTGLPQLTEALLQAGFTPEQLQALMGGNVLRLLRQGLPQQ